MPCLAVCDSLRSLEKHVSFLLVVRLERSHLLSVWLQDHTSPPLVHLDSSQMLVVPQCKHACIFTRKKYIPFPQETLPPPLDFAFVHIFYEFLLLHIQVQGEQSAVILVVMLSDRPCLQWEYNISGTSRAFTFMGGFVL
jgi:hypothetical protein